MRAKPSTLRTHGIPSAVLLVLALLAAAIGHCGSADAPETTSPSQSPAPPAAAPATASAPASPKQSGADLLKIDLTFVDRKSPAYARFRSWVDAAVAGSPGYAFSASDAALMFLLSGGDKYCDLAGRMVEKEVAEAEAAIATGARPAIAGDSYLEVGPRIADLAMTLHACRTTIDATQQRRWSSYAEQAVWNVWNHPRAQWGGQAHAWTGWSVDNPGNNYYYSFIEATMYWALVSGSPSWMDDLRTRRLPLASRDALGHLAHLLAELGHLVAHLLQLVAKLVGDAIVCRGLLLAIFDGSLQLADLLAQRCCFRTNAFSIGDFALVVRGRFLDIGLERFDLGVCLRRIELETEIDENTEKRDVEEAKIPVDYPEGSIPLTGGAPGTAEQVADLVLFLASDASSHITGTEIWIDGAQSLLQG